MTGDMFSDFHVPDEDMAARLIAHRKQRYPIAFFEDRLCMFCGGPSDGPCVGYLDQINGIITALMRGPNACRLRASASFRKGAANDVQPYGVEHH